MCDNAYRRSLLGQVASRHAAETLLKEDPLSLMTTQPPSGPPPVSVDIIIDIEVSSSDGGQNIYNEDLSLEDSLKGTLSTRRETKASERKFGTLLSKSYRRQSTTPMATQLIRLEVG